MANVKQSTGAARRLPADNRKKNSPFAEMWRRLRKNKLAMICLGFIFVLLFIVAFADLLVPYEKVVTLNQGPKLSKPSAEHWFGLDDLGRDVFARVIHGTRVSLLLGFGATAFTSIVATLLGASAAHIGGRFDAILMRIFDILISIPTILLAIAISAGFGNGIMQLIISISFGQIASFTRVVRSAVLNIAGQDYVESAKSIGLSDMEIIMGHIIPNVLGTILVQATITVGENILMGATLSFLGLGAAPPTPEWGKLLSEGLAWIRYETHVIVFPMIFIALTALSVNIFGDGLRDAFDPRLKGRA